MKAKRKRKRKRKSRARVIKLGPTGKMITRPTKPQRSPRKKPTDAVQSPEVL